MPASASVQRQANRPFIMIRLWSRHHMEEHDLEDLLKLLQENPGCCDEVWFCTPFGFPDLETHRQHAGKIAAAASRLAALGIQPGLQVANTFGHGLNPLGSAEAAIWPRMVDSGGGEASLAPCPRSPALHAYLEEIARIYASVKPSSVWIDDDLRMSHLQSAPHGCFCPRCLQAFSNEQDREFTRQQLVDALQQPDAGALRLAWTQFNGASLEQIATLVARGIHTVSPASRLGFQQLAHESFLYSGPDWNPIHCSLTRETGQPTGARLGHGYYHDHHPRLVLNKAFGIARQVSLLPDSVDQVCPEVDNFPHTAFGKTPHGMIVESTLALAMGCNSLSYALLCSDHEPASFHTPYLEQIRRHRPFWENYLAASADSLPSGIEIAMSRDHAARRLRDREEPFAWASLNLDSIYQMATLGIPFATSANVCGATILHPDAIDGFTDQALTEILARGTLLTGEGAFRIQERGLGHLLGVSVARIERVDQVFERLTPDPLNLGYAGRPWMVFLSPGSPIYRIIPLAARPLRSLGVYETQDGTQAGIATALTENEVGGRVAIFGYFHWAQWAVGQLPGPSAARRHQLLAASDWICHDRLPVRIATPAQAVVLPRTDRNGSLSSLFVLNPTIDHSPELDCELRTPIKPPLCWSTPLEKRETLPVTPNEKGTTVRIPSLPPWSFGFLHSGPTS